MAFGLGLGELKSLLGNIPDALPNVIGGKGISKTAVIVPEYWNELKEYSFATRSSDDTGSVTDELVITQGSSVGELVLNIPPQSISISTQFATSVVATNGGFLEEHNGTVFRMITISGTTGIYPNRLTNKAGKDDSILGAVAQFLPEAAGAIGGLFKAAKSTFGAIGALVGATPAASAHGKNGLTEEELKNTGYYKFWELYNFIVSYTEHKKNKDASKTRLVFNCYKDNLSYIVTPMQFDMRRDSRNPLLYNYTIVMKAWGLATSKNAPGNFFTGPDIRNPSFVKNLLEIIRRGRQTIQSASGVLRGVQSDVGDVVTGVSQVMMAANDVRGVGADALDLYPIMKANASAVFNYNRQRMGDTLNRYNGAQNNYNKLLANPASEFGKKTSKSIEKLIKDNKSLAQVLVAAAGGIGILPALSELGVTSDKDAASKGGDKGSPSGESVSKEDSAQNINSEQIMISLLNNPEAAESIKIADLTLPPAIQEQINKEIDRAKATTIGDVRRTALKLQELSDNLAAQSGMLDPTYARMFGLPVPATLSKQPTEDDIIMMADIQDLKYSLIALTATEQVFKEQGPNLFTEANNSLPASEQLPSPTSAYPIIVERGASLERIANATLGNESRAKEIAILNNLRAPYIDETGFSLNVRSATGRTFIVTDTSSMAINQVVRLLGNNQSVTRRTILNIEALGGQEFKVTVSGPTDLDRFSALTSPTVVARLPGTVGSGDTILIPSGSQPDDPISSRKTPLLERLTYAERVFKIDIALGPDGDMLMDPSGDVARSYGYQNAIQAIRLAMETEQGELRQHKSFGIPGLVGQTNNSLTPAQVAQIISGRITADPRFVDAKVGTMVEGSVIRVRIEAHGAQGTGRIPVEFLIQT